MRYPIKKDIVNRLIVEFDYPEYGAVIAARKLLHLQGSIRLLFIDWWFQGKKPSLDVEGYTFESLTESYKMNPIAAFLTLDWLIREPERAKGSLRRGHDILRIDRKKKSPTNMPVDLVDLQRKLIQNFYSCDTSYSDSIKKADDSCEKDKESKNDALLNKKTIANYQAGRILYVINIMRYIYRGRNQISGSD